MTCPGVISLLQPRFATAAAMAMAASVVDLACCRPGVPAFSFCRNYALENAMEAANLPLVELMDRSAQSQPDCTRQACPGSAPLTAAWRLQASKECYSVP